MSRQGIPPKTFAKLLDLEANVYALRDGDQKAYYAAMAVSINAQADAGWPWRASPAQLHEWDETHKYRLG